MSSPGLCTRSASCCLWRRRRFETRRKHESVQTARPRCLSRGNLTLWILDQIGYASSARSKEYEVVKHQESDKLLLAKTKLEEFLREVIVSDESKARVLDLIVMMMMMLDLC